jgi:CheY-like chemotaxis protein
MFSTGKDALRAFASCPSDYYDLFLTDIYMSKMSGFEVYRRIKDKNPLMPI